MSKQWEYLRIETDYFDCDEQLSCRGAEEWELVSTMEYGNKWMLFFKREVVNV
jgi:hypothetical protein